MRILFIGDIVGKPGRRAVRLLLPQLQKELQPDVVIANGENMAGGAGITRDTAREMLKLCITALTTGNHVWDQREAIAYLAEGVPVLRPYNWPPGTPGSGMLIVPVGKEPLALLNLQGRVFMRPLDDPFRAADTALAEIGEVRHIFVDMHAEATGEKQALARYLDGRVSAVVGTHTHVATADAQILPEGTAYLTDVGMTGPVNSIIGMEPEPVIARYRTQMYHKYDVAQGPAILSAVLIDLNSAGRAESIRLVQETV